MSGTGRERVKRDLPIDTDGPFGRLALTHLLSVGGDALVAMALAGSLFFSVDPSGARWRIFGYLVFTMAPFAVVGPLVGPAMDRAKGGRRLMLLVSTFGRVLVALLMVASVSTESLVLFPEAFVMLILAKAYQVAKAAIVPTVTDGDAALVEANSKLQLLSGLGGFAMGLPGLLLLLISPSAVMVFAAIVFTAAGVAALRVPATTVAEESAGEDEVAELRSGAVVSAGSAMGTLRGIVGFVTFLMAFALRGDDRITRSGEVLGRITSSSIDHGTVVVADLAPANAPPAWHFGVIVAVSIAGGLGGAAVAPMFRKVFREEFLLLSSLGVAACAGGAGLLMGGLFGQALLAAGVAFAAASAKQAFDAVVQRDAPDANRGRTFSRFESRFQIAWVLGALAPVIIPMPTQLGGLIVGCFAVAAGVFYATGMRAVAKGQTPPRLPTAREVGGEVRRRLRDRRTDAVTDPAEDREPPAPPGPAGPSGPPGSQAPDSEAPGSQAPDSPGPASQGDPGAPGNPGRPDAPGA